MMRIRLALLFTVCLLLAQALAVAAGEATGRENGSEKIVFKRLPAAILKLDGKQVKFWDAFQAEKRSHLLLVQLGQRFLLLDAKEKEVFELEPSAVVHKPKGEDIILERLPEHESKLESDGWSVRNVGPAVAIKLQLTAEGRVLEIQVPQRPDERRQW